MPVPPEALGNLFYGVCTLLLEFVPEGGNCRLFALSLGRFFPPGGGRGPWGFGGHRLPERGEGGGSVSVGDWQLVGGRALAEGSSVVCVGVVAVGDFCTYTRWGKAQRRVVDAYLSGEGGRGTEPLWGAHPDRDCCWAENRSVVSADGEDGISYVIYSLVESDVRPEPLE